MRKGNKVLFYLVLLLLGIVLLVVSWRVPGFSDKYVKYVFPCFVETYSRLTGLFKFSVGEIMIYVGVAYAALTLFIWILRFVLFVNGKTLFKTVSRYNSSIFFRIVIWVFLIQVLNCFIMYHTRPLYSMEAERNALVSEDTVESYVNYKPNTKDLFELREIIVSQANSLAENLPRDEKGALTYAGSMEDTAKRAMINLYEEATMLVDSEHHKEADSPGNLDAYDEGLAVIAPKLTLLKGFYPNPKPFLLSEFFSQQSMQGYYFPFSLEANYNNVMYISNIPSTMCHELAHLKGFIFEDEASFISFLACMKSEDLFFRYSALLEALAYVNAECQAELDLRPSLANEVTITPRSDLVKHDMIFLTEEAWAKVEENAILPTETVTKVSEDFLDTNLTLNGVEDGILAYSRLVDLLLKYYFGAEQ